MSKNRTLDVGAAIAGAMLLIGAWLLLGNWPSYETVLLGGYFVGGGSTLFAKKTHQVLSDD